MMLSTNCWWMCFWESQEKAQSQIILDLDAHRPAALRQAGRALLSLRRPRLLPAADILLRRSPAVRSSNIDASADSPEEMQRVVAQIRVRWPKTRIILRVTNLQTTRSNDIALRGGVIHHAEALLGKSYRG
jgi:hypothetical protein